MKDDKSDSPKKYDLDLDELSDNKPIVAGIRKLVLGNRIDFAKNSEQNQDSLTGRILDFFCAP